MLPPTPVAVTITPRPPDFAAQVLNLLVRFEIATEIGADTCFLVAAIAASEGPDGSPAKLTRAALTRLLGVPHHGRAVRARRRAIVAGWLAYVRGRKGHQSRYSVRIPDHLADLLPLDAAG